MFGSKLSVSAKLLAVLATIVAICVAPQGAAGAASRARRSAPAGPGIAAADRSDILGPHWRSSHDSLWALTSSADGLGVMRAPLANGAAWSPVVSLRVAGVDSRQWVGQACVLAHTHTLAVAYGPVEYVSVATMYERGAFAALVNLDTGATTALSVRPTYSYFSPSCGGDGTATFTSFGTTESKTIVTTVDASGHQAGAPTRIAGEYIDATHRADGTVVAARGAQIVTLRSGRATTLRTEPSTVYDLHDDRAGRLTFLVDSHTRTAVHQLVGGRDTVIATSRRGNIALESLANGAVAAHGPAIRRTGVGSWSLPQHPRRQLRVSTGRRIPSSRARPMSTRPARSVPP